MTAREAVKKALKEIGKLAVGEDVQAELETDCFDKLVDLMNSWTGLMVPSYTWDSFSLVVDQASYTIGGSGSPDVSDTRPEKIEAAFIRDSGNGDHHVDMIDEEAYRRIYDKTSSGRPEKAWYNPTVPNGTLYVYYVPTSVETFFYSHRKPITVPSGLGTTLSVSAQYEKPLIMNLALDLCPMLGREPPAALVRQALQGRRELTAINVGRNMRPPKLEILTTAYAEGTIENLGG